MNPSNQKYVIESADNVPLLLRLRDIVLTILVWLLYIWFMRNFWSFIADFCVWVWNGFENTDSYASFGLIHTFVAYFEVVLILSALFIGWSIYNILRFGKMKRRRFTTPVSTEELATKANVNIEDLETWHKSRILVMQHDKNGRLIEVIKQ